MNNGSKITVGIVGLGGMGLAVAKRLMTAGYQIIGYRRGSLDALTSLGGLAANSPTEIATNSDLVLLLLPSDDALLEVSEALLAGLSSEKVVVCLSTHAVETKSAAQEIIARTGAAFIDAEISGTPDMVAQDAASIMAAGQPHILAQAEPVLRAVASSVRTFERFGDATKMKLLANFLVAANTLAAADALTMATELGLDPAATIETLAMSAGTSRMLEIRGPMMAARTYATGDLPAFSRYFKLLANALHQLEAEPSEFFEVIEANYHEAIVAGFGGNDLAVVRETVAKHRLEPR